MWMTARWLFISGRKMDSKTETRSFEKMPETRKLLNRPKTPKMQLIGQDGNIFAIMGRASRLLKNAGQGDKAKEMCDSGHGQ